MSCLARSSMTPEVFLASVRHLHTEKEKISEKRRRRGKQRDKPCPFHNLTGLMTHKHKLLCLMCGTCSDKNSIVGEGSLGKNKFG